MISLKNHPFLSGSALILAGSLITNVLNYAFNLIVGRLLTPAEFGEVALLVTLSMLVTAPLGSIRILLTQRIATLSQTHDTLAIKALIGLTRRVSFWIGLSGTAILLALSPFAAEFFRTSLVSLLLLSFIVPVSLALSISSSIAQGLQNFRALSASSVIATLGKLLGSVALIALGWGSAGVVGALIGSALITHFFLLSLPTIKPYLSAPAPTPAPSPPRNSERGTRNFSLPFSLPPYFPIALSATILLALFGNIDVVLGKRVLDAESAGIMSAVAILGRIITYGGGAIVTVLLPMTAASLSATEVAAPPNKSARRLAASDRLLVLALAIVGGTGIACFALFFFFSEALVSLLFGARYLSAAPFLPTFGLAMLLGSLSSVFLYHFLAQLRKLFIIPYALVTVGFIASFFFVHPSIHSIVLAELIANGILLSSFVFLFFFEKYRKKVRSLSGNSLSSRDFQILSEKHED